MDNRGEETERKRQKGREEEETEGRDIREAERKRQGEQTEGNRQRASD